MASVRGWKPYRKKTEWAHLEAPHFCELEKAEFWVRLFHGDGSIPVKILQNTFEIGVFTQFFQHFSSIPDVKVKQTIDSICSIFPENSSIGLSDRPVGVICEGTEV